MVNNRPSMLSITDMFHVVLLGLLHAGYLLRRQSHLPSLLPFSSSAEPPSGAGNGTNDKLTYA